MNARRRHNMSLPAAVVATLVSVMIGSRPAVGRAASADEASWSWTPQPVAIAFETDGDPSLSPGLIRSVREATELLAREKFGAAWQLRFVDRFDGPPAPHGVPPASPNAGDSAESKEPAASATAPPDVDEKRIRVTLRRRDGRYVVEAVETDVGLRSTGPLAGRTTRQRMRVGAVGAEAVIAAYRPTARIADVRGDQAVLRLRGEALLPNATRTTLLAAGDGFVPHYRRRDRGGRIVAVDRIPWTILTVGEAAASAPRVTAASGLRNPLAAGRRGRVDLIAVAAGKPSGPTELSITAGAGGEPLAGGVVYDVAPGREPTLVGTTDRQGRITIPADGGRVRTLVVAGRYLALAKIPLITGLDPAASAALPVDARLFEAERRLANLQTEFTDRLVLRRVLALTAATQLERGDRSAAAATLTRLGKVGPTSDFVDLVEIRRRSFGLGASTSDRLIDRLYTDAVTAMRAADDGRALAELQRRLAEAK